MEQAQRLHSKRGLDWDLNDWSWDGHLFIATNTNTSSSCSDDLDTTRKRSDRDSFDEADQPPPPASLSLKLPTPTPTPSAKPPPPRPLCQVHNCVADLSLAKDYHRRHKVCEFHSKSTQALVNNLLQRFCQQCSRFHLLQEFDEGKRSCRRRLAGHNKRRRKTQPDLVVHGNSITDDHTNNVLLISLLKILSNIHFNNRSHQAADQDLVAQLLSSLANPSGMHTGKAISGLLHDSHKLLNGSIPNEIPRDGVHTVDNRGVEMQAASPQSPGSLFPIKESPPAAFSDSSAGRKKLNNFDLNDIYIDSDDGTEDLERSPITDNYASASTDYPPWARHDSQQSSPPQNSDSASGQSPSSSSGEAQSRTDRIVFKLFGKEPSEFPMVLRGQILDWLAHSPTDIESYIRPGCIILTVYLRLAEPLWEEICSDLSSCLTRLFDTSNDPFWSTGWIFVQVQNQIAFAHNGQVMLDTPLSLEDSNSSRILSVIPVAVAVGKQAQFHVRGYNLSRSATRLLCAIEGKYLDQDSSQDLGVDGHSDNEDDIENANLTCDIPNIVGRGFIEVEDHGLSSSFFPFIVAEKDVCSDIRRLESVLELKETAENKYEFDESSEARRQALNFLNEMGWLLHRIQLKSRLAHIDPNTAIFSFKRFRWLMDFSMDHDWCAVVKKLLDIWIAGSVGSGEHPSLNVALTEMGLLHRAVRRNCRSMVELLLGYVPTNCAEEFRSAVNGDQEGLLFTPDAQGPGGLTPLHVAAGRDGSEEILDALTDDPKKIGVEAWKNARDSTGASPEDYARLRGHYAYIHLVQRKMNRRPAAGQVVIDIPRECSEGDNAKKQEGAASSFEIGRVALMQSCKLCDGNRGYYGNVRTSMVYRPAMLSLVAIAAVCVCVALLFKSMPTVVCLFQPFRWESLNYGSS
ncbi:hypothetical protein RND81_02G000800 [Saponaria officinalis]|uniref:SBP-type domain-containing protein n=1 Tax=Saponaria officinalis TaxID=3572 RepID=A0AAW1MP45_SAPOF